MQVTREDLNPCTIQLSIVCDPEEVKTGFERAFKQLTKKVKIPGFRPGMAPRKMLEDIVPLQEWNEAAADEIVRSVLKKAIDEQKLEPDYSTRQSVELKALDKDAGKAEFVAKVPLPPKVELGDYKGLPIERPPLDVTDEEVEYQVTELRKRGQTRQAVTDRGVEEGDVAVINIKIEGETGEGKNFMSVAGQNFPQLDEALTGMKVEEMKNLELTFPENFQEKTWAGQTHKVQVTVNSLSAVTLPELDDAFAQSLKTENVDDLKEKIRSGISSAKEQMVRQMLHDQLLTKLMERSQVSVSDNMWEGLALRRLQETAQEQARQQKTLEQYAAENGMTVDQLAQAWRERAKLEVERALLIQGVFSGEKMQLTNEDLNQELFAMAGEFGMSPEDLFKMLQTNQAMDELQFRSLARKVGDFLLQNAEVTEAAPAKAE